MFSFYTYKLTTLNQKSIETGNRSLPFKLEINSELLACG